ncbi:MAG: FtsX-like permease family protein [Dehalobacter sp. 4CP]|uniref:ABC transporter permease n=1 Tax=Dehalobacter sp. CP TaxID=2594474 RepID=UPI0013C71511|nr:FtsX-like permease family protein [Dehalobacter sp.]NBJ15884.1 FtsX-like permease family protein [Dehalobacter sp. 4CP]
MIKVENKKAIRHLAEKSFRANKARNIIAIIAIALTTVLLTSLFTMGIGTVESIQQATMRQAGGDGHAVLKYITDEEYDNIKGHPLIKEIAYNRILCDGVENKAFVKRRAEFWYYDDVGLKLGFCEPTSGHKPVAEKEVIADTRTLELMGVPLEVGAPLTLTLNIRGKEIQRNFFLAGWWESDPVFNVGQIFASRAYVDAHLAELHNTYKEDSSLAGAINAYIMFKNSMDLEGKLSKVITDSGYSIDENAPNYLAHNVNWAYLSTNFGMDAGTVMALLLGLLLIVFTGYLIIYNIFQISVIRDIRFYGLLKTIGTTGTQIRRIIRRQALILSAMGIPIGLIIGFFIGRSIVPIIMNNTAYAGSTVSVSANPRIFIGSALFALVTVLISTFKPGRIAAAVSPVEAVRYTDGNIIQNGKLKKTTDGGKMPRMALANLVRNKRRTVLVVINMALSLVLLNTVFTLSQSIDINKFLAKFVDTDFLIAHADYFQNDFSGSENQTTESFIQAVKAQPGFEEGGRLYGGREEGFAVEDEKNTAQDYNKNPYGHFFAAGYGLEDLPLQRLELIDGELDDAKLATGKYILEGVQLDDNSIPKMDSAHFAVGETVTLHNYKGTSEAFTDREYTTQEFIVLGHVAIKHFSNSDRTGWDYNFYLPADVYKKLVTMPAIMSYAFNVSEDQEAAMERFLQSYTGLVEPVMNYTSKFTSLKEFSGMQMTVVMIGGALSLIIGLIGILNFVNAILTSILTRRKEFAMLQSIGMTRKQLRRMLMFEGFYYTFGTCILSFVFTTLFSLLIVKAFCRLLWFFSYHFILWPVLSVLPFLLVLGVMIPLVSYALTDKQSIVERLREAE